MGPTQILAAHLLNCSAETFEVEAIAAETGLNRKQVYSGLHYFVDIGAAKKVPRANGRIGHVYAVANRDELERRLDGRARRQVAEADDTPPLNIYIDDDGDLQLVRGDEAYHISNRDARRLLAFVATQATAIMTAGA